MTDIDYEKMWKEIIEVNYAETHLLAGEKTVMMFAKEANVSEETARRLLDKLVKDNKMKKRIVRLGRARVGVYSPISIEK